MEQHNIKNLKQGYTCALIVAPRGQAREATGEIGIPGRLGKWRQKVLKVAAVNYYPRGKSGAELAILAYTQG